MAYTYNSIVIERPLEEVFAASNRLEDWTQIFDEYEDLTILEHEGNRFVFRLTNKEKKSWRSTRILDPSHWIATATREDPLFPFRYMTLRWIYRPVPGGTEMTWEQFFEMDPASGMSDASAVERIVAHSQINMKHFKHWIEAKGVDA